MCNVSMQPALQAMPVDEGVGIVAHELRDPLAAVLMALAAIPDDGDPATQRTCRMAEHQMQRVLRIIDDLFDLRAASLDRLSLHQEMVALATIVADATETTAHRLAARGHRLTVSLPNEPVLLFADSLRLEQVLTNLLGNAAKFTDPGGHIHLAAAVEAGEVVVRVRDNGRGISPAHLPRVFDLYQQVPGSASRGKRGLGIGLALVKALVELHGGSVAAFSDGPGAGSEFVVRLPTCATVTAISACANVQRQEEQD
jgi:signal transduction histidine kinase